MAYRVGQFLPAGLDVKGEDLPILVHPSLLPHILHVPAAVVASLEFKAEGVWWSLRHQRGCGLPIPLYVKLGLGNGLTARERERERERENVGEQGVCRASRE